MLKLNSDFQYHKYGIDVRLVNERDADFILKLRVNSKLSRYIHFTENNLDKQIEWIRSYKLREAEGKEYYFIYSVAGKYIGVNRLYDIKKDNLTAGSWICAEGIPYNYSILTSVIGREIIFDILGYSIYQFDVRKKNIKVLKFHQSLGGKIYDESELDYYLTLTKEDFNKNKKNLLRLLGVRYD